LGDLFKNLDALSRAGENFCAFLVMQTANSGIDLLHIPVAGGTSNAPVHQPMSLSSI
jgi:hypothetical protein